MTTTANKDEALIQQVITSFADAWNVHNAKAFAQLFAEDAEFTNVFGIKKQGRLYIEQFHAHLFETMFKNSAFTPVETSVRLLSETIAAVDTIWTMSGATNPQGEPWPDRKGLMCLVMQKEKETWLIVVMHNMDLPERPLMM